MPSTSSRRLTRACALLIALALMLAGCGSSARTDEVETAVREYNRQLVRAYAQLDMTALSTVATVEQATTEYYLMAALGEGRVQMLATLTSIEFGEVTFPEEGKASVTTTEVWDYDHVSLDTSETVRTERGLVYHLRYDLVSQDGRWLVDAITSLDAETESQETTP